jgi:hypothetical protein
MVEVQTLPGANICPPIHGHKKTTLKRVVSIQALSYSLKYGFSFVLRRLNPVTPNQTTKLLPALAQPVHKQRGETNHELHHFYFSRQQATHLHLMQHLDLRTTMLQNQEC